MDSQFLGMERVNSTDFSIYQIEASAPNKSSGNSSNQIYLCICHTLWVFFISFFKSLKLCCGFLNLLVLCEIHIMCPNPTHLSLLSYPPSTLATSPPQEKKKILQWRLQCVPEYTLWSTLLCLQVFIAVTPWSGTRPLASAALSVLEPHWDSSRIFCCYPVLWESCSFGSVGPAPSCTPIVPLLMG